MGHQHQLVAVGQVSVDKIIQQGPFQPGAQARIDPEAGARQLGASLIVDQAQVRAEVYVMLGLKIELMGLAVLAQGLVVLLAAGLQVGVGEVGQA